MHISQPNYALSFIEEVQMQAANPAKTLSLYGVQLHECEPGEQPLETDSYIYSRTVGTLRYLVDCSRPDLAYITGMLARYMQRPTM